MTVNSPFSYSVLTFARARSHGSVITRSNLLYVISIW